MPECRKPLQPSLACRDTNHNTVGMNQQQTFQDCTPPMNLQYGRRFDDEQGRKNCERLKLLKLLMRVSVEKDRGSHISSYLRNLSYSTVKMDHEQEIRVMQREYFDFLDDEADQGIYSTTVSRMLEDGQNRLIVDMVDLRKKNRKRAEGLLKAPVDELIAFQGALKEMVGLLKPELAKELSNMEFFVGLEGTFGSKHVSPRSLSSRFLGSLVCCDGIVTKCTTIKPKVVKSVHYCPATQRTMERRYTDLTSSDPFPSSASYPTKTDVIGILMQDEDGNPLETEYGLSSYKDHQIFSIQEMPEKAPAGQLPRSVDVMVEHSLVDSCKPGDRVQVVGEFRCLPSKQGNPSTKTTVSLRSIILANNVITMSKAADVNITTEEFTKIRSFAKQNGRTVFDTLARSLAPSIHGHE
ncbi:unnamed protein product [Notodromas monacha]|uniref:DNA replication licensing factor MCM3 n=1 Tax=Notodromas monacha TaxID=399045 RepID=A0A7R9BY49_9CRUS|nr:unnamed protein product [Notodromas monacha]CAG0923897.1 unnamed protein product [Notodromas monacha]